MYLSKQFMYMPTAATQSMYIYKNITSIHHCLVGTSPIHNTYNSYPTGKFSIIFVSFKLDNNSYKHLGITCTCVSYINIGTIYIKT